MSAPPDGLPLYRVLTGPDDEAFCRRVSEAIALGYRLHEGPAVTFNGEQVIVAQALLWPGARGPGRLPARTVEPVRRWDGRSGRVDLHLAAKYQEHDRIRHLIVELKAPTVTVGRKELDEIEDYADVIVSTPGSPAAQPSGT
jgi:hypothetical protein